MKKYMKHSLSVVGKVRAVFLRTFLGIRTADTFCALFLFTVNIGKGNAYNKNQY